MGKFNKTTYMQGCRLISSICGDTSDMYQFIFNPETAEYSDIYPCDTGSEFEIEEDGWYRLVTFKKPNATIENGAIVIDGESYDSYFIMDDLKNNEEAFWNPKYMDEYDIEDVFSVCKLKQCLAELELKTFRDMLKNCGKIQCKENDDVKAQRDFLYIAVWLIEHYAELGKIDEALAIYNRLKGCGDICKNLLKDKRSCGCNG